MTIFYCDHDIYAAPVAAGTVPTAAEDGNGKAKTAATMATLGIGFTGQPTADQAITIAGVTFTAKTSGATGNQFNIGASTTDTATNLKTAINASATNATQPAGAIAATAPVRNVVNATSSGAVVTVYTRCAGSEWNSVTENSTLSNVTLTQWSGGADGAWGYVLNNASIGWPTTKAVGSYGVMAQAAGKPYIGAPTGGDIVHIRSGKSIDFTATAAFSPAWYGASGSSLLTYSVGDTSIWTGDSVDAELVIQHSHTNGASLFVGAVNGYYFFKGGRKGDGSQRTKVLRNNYGAGNTGLEIGTGHLSVVEDVEVSYTATASQCYSRIATSYTSNTSLLRRVRCRSDNTGYAIVAMTNNVGMQSMLEDCEIATAAGSAWSTTGIFGLGGGASSIFLSLYSCKFTGFVIGSKLLTTAAGGKINLLLEECDLGNVTLGRGNVISQWSTANANPSQNYNIQTQSFGRQEFIIDNGLSSVEWNNSLSFPTLNAVVRDGVNKQSWHMYPSRIANRLQISQPAEFPLITKINTLANGQRTFRLEALIAKTLTASVDSGNFWMVVSYTDTSGVRRQVTTQASPPVALSASTAAWTNTGTDPADSQTRVSFSDGGTVWHDRVYMAVTTPTGWDVALDSDMTFYIAFAVTPAVSTEGVFIDPEIQVS